MRSPVLWWVSVALNVALVWLLVNEQRTHAPAPQLPPLMVRTQQVHGPVRVLRTNVYVPAQPFTWKQIESPDYFQYAANLRAIGCPEPTIRDIIVADVNQLFAKRKAALLDTNQDDWWRSEPDLDRLSETVNQLEKLETERRQLLTKLLGPNWDASGQTESRRAATGGLLFEGTVLSQLSVETTQAVRQEWEKLQKRYAEYRQTQEKTGKPVEPLVVAQMHREYREQLERLLTSEQLEEFLLRNSQVSQRLRQDLAGFNTTSEEFRAIFKARDAAERQLMWATVTSLESYAQQRQQLNQQAEKEIERALGPERYREYKFNSDPVYREARSFAEDFGAAPEAVVPLYEIRRTTAAEEQQIRNDSTMTPEERIAALQAVRQYSEEAIRQLIGDEAYARYEKSLGKPKK